MAAVLAVVVATSVWAATAVNVTVTWRDVHPGDQPEDIGTIEWVQGPWVQDAATLTGTIGDVNAPRIEILEGRITRKGEVSFLIDTVTPEPENLPFVGVHRGKLRPDGNTIKGTYTFSADGGPEQTVGWTATRVR